jgi:hypothetical protein
MAISLNFLRRKENKQNKPAQELQLITSSALLVTRTTSSTLSTASVSTPHPSIHGPSSSDAPMPFNSSNLYSEQLSHIRRTSNFRARKRGFIAQKGLYIT